MSDTIPYNPIDVSEVNTRSWNHVIRRGAHSESGIEFNFIKYTGKKADSEYIIDDSSTYVQVKDDFGRGTLIRVEDGEKMYTLWIPVKPVSFNFDEDGRIRQDIFNPVNSRWSWFPDIKLEVKDKKEDESVCFVYLKMEDADAQFFNELSTLSEIESTRYLKSDWFNAGNPSDFWNYFIDGNIYDPRAGRAVGKRFKCQQCAFAWWEYFGMLSEKTGKRIYSHLQDEIARSVLSDFVKYGTWLHGYWFDSMEIHARFYLDGINLLISQFEKSGDPFWLEKANNAMNYFIENLTDQFDNGNTWFLHDSVQEKRPHKFQSAIFGKNPANTLCINTHVQALCVLQRLVKYESDVTRFQQYYHSGTNALIQVLGYQPANFLYRRLEKALLYTPWKKKSTNSFILMSIYSLQGVVARRLYWKIMKQYPRMVYEGGFTERDLSLSMMSMRYHVINMKDLLMLYHNDPNNEFLYYIEKGVEFIADEVNHRSYKACLIESDYFIEYMDILKLQEKTMHKDTGENLSEMEKIMTDTLGGVSLDYHVMG